MTNATCYTTQATEKIVTSIRFRWLRSHVWGGVPVGLGLMFLALFLAGAPTVAHATLIGPSSYSSFANSPFVGVDFSGGYFHLEDFEDGLNTPGVSPTPGGVLASSFGCAPGCVDTVNPSVESDSWFDSSPASVTWTFDVDVLGILPTHVGIVWTDGKNNITFEAFDAWGSSLGVLIGSHADGSFFGTTDEDRFYGAIYGGGISKIILTSSNSSGIEMDHLQYGRVPEPGTLALLGVGLLGLGFLRRRRARI